MPNRRAPGYTLLELVVVLALVAIMVTMAYTRHERDLPRARLFATAVDLQALIQGARLRALASGRDVAVLVYPNQVTPSGTGRVVVYADGTGGFMSGATPPLAAGDPSFDSFDPDTMKTRAPPHEILDTLDLPRLVALAPVANPALLAAALTFPYTTVPSPAGGCSFCAGGKGAIRFDARGNATFYPTTLPAPPAPNRGGSLSLTSADVAGSRVLVVTPYGNVRTFNAE